MAEKKAVFTHLGCLVGGGVTGAHHCPPLCRVFVLAGPDPHAYLHTEISNSLFEKNFLREEGRVFVHSLSWSKEP
eukprot:COSAG06_NODE_5008_length_3794_cov_4.359946_2_plen_75_part_00